MSIIRTILSGERRDVSTLANPSDALISALTGSPSFTGRSMSADRALGLPAVFAAVRLLAESVGALPFVAYHESANGRVRAPDSRLWTLIHDEANPEMAAGELWEIVTGHLNLWGNAYIYKERDARGFVTALWPILPSRVRVGRDRGEKVYEIQNGGEIAAGTDRDVLHVRAFGTTGLVGLSPIEQLRQSLALADAQQEFSTRFYANNAQPGGILTLGAGRMLDDEGIKRLRASWDAAHKGLDNAGKVAVLEEGTEWQPLTIPMGDQQFIEQRRFSVQEVCRIFRIPAWMLGESAGDSLTYSNVEAQADAFVKWSLLPWLRRLEGSVRRDGDLTYEQGITAKFSVDALLRADAATRSAFYASGIQNGWLSPNEARESEDRNPVEGLDSYNEPTGPVAAPGEGV